MTTFQDLMHDLGGEYTKLRMGSVVVNEDLALLIKDGHIKATEKELIDTITYAETVLTRVKQYMVVAWGIISLVKPLIDERVGCDNEIYSMKVPNDQISNLAAKTIVALRNCNLKDFSESQVVEGVKTSEENIRQIIENSKKAENIFFTVKPKLYEIIGQKTEVAFGNGYKVLLLDDQPDICQYLKSFLIKKGFDVETANTADEAIDLVKRIKPKIALLDIKLGSPTVSGIDVLKFIRNYDSGCKILMITLVDDKEILQKCQDLGAAGSLTKPVDVNEMKNILYKTVLEILNGT